MRLVLHPELESFFIEWKLQHQQDVGFVKKLGNTGLLLLVKVQTHHEGGTTYTVVPELVSAQQKDNTLVQLQPLRIVPEDTKTAGRRAHWQTGLLRELRRLTEISKRIPRCSCGPRAFNHEHGGPQWVCVYKKCVPMPAHDMLQVDARAIRLTLVPAAPTISVPN